MERGELGSKGKSKLEKYPSSRVPFILYGNKRRKGRRFLNEKWEEGRCVLARGKNFSSSLTRPGKGVEKSRSVGDEVHLASRWKGCSIRGKSKAGKGTRLGKTTTSRMGNPSFRSVSFGRERRYKGRTMVERMESEKGNSCWSKA